MKNTWLIPIIEEMEKNGYGKLEINFFAGSIGAVNQTRSIKPPQINKDVKDIDSSLKPK